jgi:endoribonuclease Dicer
MLHYQVGTSSSGVGDLNISFRQQVIAMTKFRKGTLNCLFATSVAEEGLDIPECNLVIRFDLYATLIQYIQSRGRARQPNSQYIHMVEHENRIHSEIIKQVYKGEKIMRRFCESLPEDRLLTGNDYDIEYLLSQEKKVRHYTDPASGAKLTYRLSLMVLSNFVGSLPQNSDCGLKAEYVLTGLGKQFLCEVILPSNSPIHGAIGRPASTKQIAKCSAAFEACLLLRQKNFLDEHFLSTFVKELPAMRNAVLAVSSKSQEQYNMRTKPILWAAANVPTELYLTVLTLANPSSLGRPSQPLGILTRGLLPQLPQFPLFFGKDRTSLVQMLPLSTALLVDTHRLNSVNMFTLRIFDDVFSKEYESDVSKMPYFLVPLKDTLEITRNHQPAEIICWDVIAEVEEHEWLPWDEKTPDAFFEDRYVVDPFDGSRKLWAVKVTHNYRPLDPVPANCAPRIGTRKNNDNILEYSCSLWAKARARRTFKEDQPVIEAEFIPLRRNLLDDSSQDESQAPRRCFVVPEPLKISTVCLSISAKDIF